MDFVYWLLEEEWVPVPEPAHGMVVQMWRIANLPLCAPIHTDTESWRMWAFDTQTMLATQVSLLASPVSQVSLRVQVARERRVVRQFAILFGEAAYGLPLFNIWWLHAHPRLLRLPRTIQDILNTALETGSQCVRTRIVMFDAPATIDIVTERFQVEAAHGMLNLRLITVRRVPGQ
jgi:hypothetical protein